MDRTPMTETGTFKKTLQTARDANEGDEVRVLYVSAINGAEQTVYLTLTSVDVTETIYGEPAASFEGTDGKDDFRVFATPDGSTVTTVRYNWLCGEKTTVAGTHRRNRKGTDAAVGIVARADTGPTGDETVQTLVRALAADVEHGNTAALRQDVLDLYEHLLDEHPADDEWTPDGWGAGR